MAKYTDINQLIEHLKKHWGEDRKCPFCGNTGWSVSNVICELRQHQRTFSAKATDGTIFPVIPVTCIKCGNTVLINAIIANLFD